MVRHGARLGLILLGASGQLLGCSPASVEVEQDVPIETAASFASRDGSQPAVGEACAPEDGWLPGQVHAVTPLEAVVPPTLDYANLPGGIGYCLFRGSYPNGYFTMNCANDAECPGEARCDDGNKCRKLCKTDEDCSSPSVCRPHGEPALWFCECANCVGSQ